MTGNSQRTDQVGEEGVRPGHERPPAGVGRHRRRCQRLAGRLDGAFKQGRPAVVERMGEGCVGMDQDEAVVGQRQRLQERRGERERVHGRANVVLESGQSQLGGAGASSDRRGGLDDQEHRPARARVMAAARPLGPAPTTMASYCERAARGFGVVLMRKAAPGGSSRDSGSAGTGRTCLPLDEHLQ